MRVLVAPMDWGLGHASRCVPLIRELIRQGAAVTLASAGPALALLQRCFPELPAVTLPAYDVRYPSRYMAWNLTWQAPKLARTIWAEGRATDQLVRQRKMDVVISDNRFGCRSPHSHNIFLTHQLSIRAPGALATRLVNRANHFFIQQFNECWIPDVPEPDSLSGALSEATLSIPIRRIGWLSQQRPRQAPIRYLCAAVLSGPEPQRSRLEAILRPQLAALARPCLLVRGKLDDTLPVEQHGTLTVAPYLVGEALNEAMAAAQFVVARSGYSTLMDLAVLGKKALFIPTPGQTEQIYLARRLAARGRCLMQTQGQVDIASALKEMDRILPTPFPPTGDLLKETVEKLVFA